MFTLAPSSTPCNIANPDNFAKLSLTKGSNLGFVAIKSCCILSMYWILFSNFTLNSGEKVLTRKASSSAKFKSFLPALVKPWTFLRREAIDLLLAPALYTIPLNNPIASSIWESDSPPKKFWSCASCPKDADPIIMCLFPRATSLKKAGKLDSNTIERTFSVAKFKELLSLAICFSSANVVWPLILTASR